MNLSLRTKIMKKILFTILLVVCSIGVSQANVIINTTRVIYPAQQKEVSVQLLNKGEQPALIQAWIDEGQPDSTPETSQVPFQLAPPVSKVDGLSGQQLRIRAQASALPQDRESVFYLNVLDIPPEPDNHAEVNLMQVAIKSRIKLFYRPQGLKSPPGQILCKITASSDPNTLRLENQGPYFITVIGLKNNSGQSLINEGVMLAPFSQSGLSIKATTGGNTLQLMTIDDFGAYQSTNIQIQ